MKNFLLALIAVFLLALLSVGALRVFSPETYERLTAPWRLPAASLAVQPPASPPPAQGKPEEKPMSLDAVLAAQNRAENELTPHTRRHPKVFNLKNAKPPARVKPLRTEYPRLAAYSPQVPIINRVLDSRQGCMMWPDRKECRGRALGGGLRADYFVSDTRIMRTVYNPSLQEVISETTVWFNGLLPRVEDHLSHSETPSPTCCWNVRWLFAADGNIEKVVIVTENGAFGHVRYGTDGALLEDSTPPDGPVPGLYKNRPRRYCDIHPQDREICG